MKKLAITLLSFALLCGGIWCASYVSSHKTDCHSDMYAVLCANTLEHGSIMSGALLVEIFVLAIVVLSFIRFVWGINITHLRYAEDVLYRTSYLVPRSELALAFARGIVHPRKP